MGQPNMLGKVLVCFLVSKIMGDVSKEGPLRLELFHQSQGVGDRGMRWVGAMSQRVKKKYIEALQLAHGVRRNLTEVGEICSVAETEAVNNGITVQDFHRVKASAEQVERSVEAFHLHPGDPAVLVISVKDVTKNAFQSGSS